MKQEFGNIAISTAGPGLYDVTEKACGFVRGSGIVDGLLTCFVRHTSASLVVQENADPDVLADLETFLRRLVSRDTDRYRHTTEGPDDMPAHIRTMLTATSISIPVRDAKPLLGTWQAVYMFEHRDAPHRREVELHIIGE